MRTADGILIKHNIHVTDLADAAAVPLRKNNVNEQDGYLNVALSRGTCSCHTVNETFDIFPFGVFEICLHHHSSFRTPNGHCRPSFLYRISAVLSRVMFYFATKRWPRARSLVHQSSSIRSTGKPLVWFFFFKEDSVISERMGPNTYEVPDNILHMGMCF